MSIIQAGQVIFGNIPFANGNITSYRRYYVVFKVSSDYIYLLNCSSIKGKEHKLLLPSNEKLDNCIPPLTKDTMIKMDEIYAIPLTCESLFQIKSPSLPIETLKKVESDLKNFINKKHVANPSIMKYTYEQISICN
ncbi:hypothetical protein WL735_11145 [Staphylococcus hominis]|uniref:hypothetical protein n=1 Tax=Staphylococcus hominis TaxID=1290 RepID=UPI0030BCC5C6